MSSTIASTTKSSPRSTVWSGSDHMTTAAPPVNQSNTMASDFGADESKVTSPAKDVSEGPTPASPAVEAKDVSSNGFGKLRSVKETEVGDPQLSPRTQIFNPYGQSISMTPNPGGAYYIGYQSQATPEPPSPAGGTTMYDMNPFFPSGAFATQSSPFGAPNTPLSPPRQTATVSMVGIPPSPLFPRVSSGSLGGTVSGVIDVVTGQRHGGGPPPSPSLPAYFSSNMYPVYSIPAVGSQNSNSPEDGGSGWGDMNQNHPQAAYPSPQMNAQVMPMGYGTRAGVGARAHSFEEAMLPPSALDQPESPAPYSPYPATPTSTGGPLFAPPFYGAPLDMYSSPGAGSPLQPRPTTHPHVSMYPGGPMSAGMRPAAVAPFGQFYQHSTSPGPPIQTTASNKGPDGANLFIFHIPNHFTNMDMYNLFCPYGNLLSVRIMVERDTGRSRGFGFVSYDTPESAAIAIKELNGYAIGNKRLKVQHKQIRPKDLHDRDNSQSGFGMTSSDGGNYQRPAFGSLPPSGPMAFWLDSRKIQPSDHDGGGASVGGSASGGGGGVMSGNTESGQGSEDRTITDKERELPSTSVSAETSLQLGTGDNSSAAAAAAAASMSPLASLGSLQNALPDVAGKGTPE